jgi:hypothetical protein
LRNAPTRSSRPAQILETCDFEMPVSTPIAATRSSTDRVETPLTYASITTAYNAWSIRRRGSSSGEERALAKLRDPHLEVPSLGRQDPRAGAVAVRYPIIGSFVAASPDLLGSFGINELLQRPLGELTD